MLMNMYQYFTLHLYLSKTPEDKDEHVSNFNNSFHLMCRYIKSSLFYQDFFSQNY